MHYWIAIPSLPILQIQLFLTDGRQSGQEINVLHLPHLLSQSDIHDADLMLNLNTAFGGSLEDSACRAYQSVRLQPSRVVNIGTSAIRNANMRNHLWTCGDTSSSQEQ